MKFSNIHPTQPLLSPTGCGQIRGLSVFILKLILIIIGNVIIPLHPYNLNFIFYIVIQNCCKNLTTPIKIIHL